MNDSRRNGASIAPVAGVGFYCGPSSWACHARAFFMALNGIQPLTVYPLDQDQSYDFLTAQEGALVADHSSTSDDAICIGVGPIECMAQLSGRYRIAFVVWETTILPRDKRRLLQSMDEVWTPSQWGREVMIKNGIAENRVFVVPEGVNAGRFAPGVGNPHSASRPFRFLCVGKWEVRKGIDDLVEAFAQEFRPDEDVELVLHAHNPWVPGFRQRTNIARALLGRSARVVASEPVSEQDMCSLYNACDAFVLPTRAEGWGLPILEAMACGLPVIVTNYSAPAEFLNERVAYPLAVKQMVPVYDPLFFPEGGEYGEWAQPDWECLRSLLRAVYEMRDEAAEKGRLAREEVCRRWTWDHAARIAFDRLQQIVPC